MIVLDASAVLELVLVTDGGELVRERIAAPSETLHVPHLIDLEVLQVLRSYCASGVLDPSGSTGAVPETTIRSPTRTARLNPIVASYGEAEDARRLTPSSG